MRDVFWQTLALLATAVAFYNLGLVIQHSRETIAIEEFENEFIEKLIARCEEAGITDTELVIRKMRELDAEYLENPYQVKKKS